jgi:hypothetical protein
MREDIEINNKLGKKAMSYLRDWLAVYKLDLERNGKVSFKWYPDKIWENDKEVGYKQDADLIYNNHIYPVEVKVTRFAFPERIFIRKSSIDHLPYNGYIYLSESEKFCMIKRKEIVSNKTEKISEWGNKECYVLNKSLLKWESHIENAF